jgi:hypothetical protein
MFEKKQCFVQRIYNVRYTNVKKSQYIYVGSFVDVVAKAAYLFYPRKVFWSQSYQTFFFVK